MTIIITYAWFTFGPGFVDRTGYSQQPQDCAD